MRHLVTAQEESFPTTSIKIALCTVFFWIILPFTLQASIDTSSGSGEWGDTNTWQDGSVPTSSDSVVIESEHLVEIKNNSSCEFIDIIEGGAFNNTVLRVFDGNKITVNDDVFIRGDGGTAYLHIKGSAEADIDGDLTFVGSSSDGKLHMSEGASTLHLGGNLVLNTTGDILGGTDSEFIFDGSSQSIDISSTTNFNDLTINASSIVTLNGAISSSEISGDLVVQGGTFNNDGNSISGDSTFQVQSNATFLMKGTTGLPSNFTHDIQSGAILEYAGGSQTINMPNNSQNFSDLTISGTGTKSLGEAITVDGDLTIETQTLDANGNNITIKGDWLNRGGSFSSGSASVTFQGGSEQKIKSNGSSFNNVTFDNGSDFTLEDVMTVDGSCSMTDGVITTGNDTLVLKSTTASDLSGYGNTSFVNGNLKRFIGSNTSTYDFPVGDGKQTSNYYRAELINSNLSGVDYIEAGYLNISSSADDSIDTKHISPDDTINYAQLVRADGVWMLEPDNSPTSGSYDLKLHIDNYVQTGLEDNAIGIVKRPLGSSNNGANWSSAGDINASDGDGRLVSDGYVKSKNLSSFSEFGVGGNDQTTPLPIQLLHFDGKMIDNTKAQLEWATATETDNEFFSVQRSTDGSAFQTIAKVAGAGNSNTKQHYEHTDAKPLKGTSYYRLKQTDFNGEYTYSRIISLSKENRDLHIDISPNPVQQGQSISIDIGEIDPDRLNGSSVRVYKAVTGELVSDFELTDKQVNYQVPGHIKNGLYIVQGQIGDRTFTKKLVIQ